MKVLVINTSNTGKDGVTSVICNYFKAMDLSNVRMDLVTINRPDKDIFELFHRADGRVYVIKRRMSTIYFYIYRLAKIIRREKYDIVHIHASSHLAVIDLLAAYLGGCKVRIVHSHNTTCTHPFLHKFFTPLFNFLITERFACGVDAGKWLHGNSKFRVINNGIDTNKYAYNKNERAVIREGYGWKSNEIVIGHVGYFYPVKNHSFIIDVFYELIKRNNSYRLLLLGDGILRNEVEEKVKTLDLQNYVIMPGAVDNVQDYLNAMDFILMPSLFEGLPLTLIEQQANGLNCFVSDNISSEVDKTGNLVFVSLENDAKYWADIIEKTPLNVDREKLSCDSIEKIKESGYSIQAEAAKLKELYFRAKKTNS